MNSQDRLVVPSFAHSTSIYWTINVWGALVGSGIKITNTRYYVSNVLRS